MSIRMLEEELGFKIFDRSNSGVEFIEQKEWSYFNMVKKLKEIWT